MFFVSLILILISSYFVVSVFSPVEKNKKTAGFLIFLISIFAQVVLSFEILSLFQAINRINILIMHAIFCVISGFFWFKKGMPFYKLAVKETASRILKALKKDKILMIMAFGLLFMLVITIFLNVFLPVSSYDALTYHLNRVAFWMSQGSLNHFDIVDDRNLVMPINSEILYLWVLLFVKKDIGLNFLFIFRLYSFCIKHIQHSRYFWIL